MPDSPVISPIPALCVALAADLTAADLHTASLRALWGADADEALGRGLIQPALRAMAGITRPQATLARFFLIGLPQHAADVARALPHLGLAGVEELGLSRRDGEFVRPLALVRPQSFEDDLGRGEWWIASDLDEVALGGELPPDHVLGVGGASRTLAELVVPVKVDDALDVGTGCGIQALLLSRRASRVVATDVSRRALNFAQLNAWLNGIENIEFRYGALFDPVQGELYDLVVSNPPFVITPRRTGTPEFEYRDGGMVGDAFVERFVCDVVPLLREGGIAQLLGNWEERDTASRFDRIRGWLVRDIDAWVVEREVLSPIGYAELWIRDGGTSPRDLRFGELFTAWLDDFAARGVTRIGFGYILLRKKFGAGAGIRRLETITGEIPNTGRALDDGLRAMDLLVDGVPETLVVAEDVTEARHHLPGTESPNVIELRQGGGFGRTVQVGPALAGLVGASDGELTVTQIVHALAEIFGVPPEDLWADLEPQVRALVADGFLRAPETAAPSPESGL